MDTPARRRRSTALLCARSPYLPCSPYSPHYDVQAPYSLALLTPPPVRPTERIREALVSVIQSNSAKYLLAGAVAGVISRTVVSPLEVVATVNMINTGASRPLHHELSALFRAEGVRGFFKGNGANCLKVAPTKGLQFLAFEALKRLVKAVRTREHDRPLAPHERLAAGGFAGVLAATACYPLEVAKTLLTLHPERYAGVTATLRSVARSQGARALYRGLGPTVVAMFPYVGIEFMVYEHLKLAHESANDGRSDIRLLICIGALAGAIAQTVCHPLDVVRKRLQLQGVAGRAVLYRSMVDAARGIIRKEGGGALYRGLQPMYVSVLPSAGVSYLVYECVKDMLGVRSLQ